MNVYNKRAHVRGGRPYDVLPLSSGEYAVCYDKDMVVLSRGAGVLPTEKAKEEIDFLSTTVMFPVRDVSGYFEFKEHGCFMPHRLFYKLRED